MADLKIYNNGENKVLMSAGDRIIRQPYEFENGFLKTAGVYLSLDTQSELIASNGYTVLTWFNGQQPIGDSCHLCVETSSHSYRYYVQSTGTGIIQRGAQTLIGSGNILKPSMMGGSTNSLYKEKSIITTIRLEGDVSRILIGAYTTTSGGSITQSSSGGLNDELFIFNRQISDGEYRYIYANGIGAESQLNNGLVGRYNFNIAEILSNGGGDFVGFRNISNLTNKLLNINIIGLPAGTLSEQLLYANSNILKPFRQ